MSVRRHCKNCSSIFDDSKPHFQLSCRAGGTHEAAPGSVSAASDEGESVEIVSLKDAEGKPLAIHYPPNSPAEAARPASDQVDDDSEGEKCSVCGDVNCRLEETSAGHAYGRPKA